MYCTHFFLHHFKFKDRCCKNGQDDNKNLVNGDDKKTGVENNKNALTIENVSTQNGVSEEKKTSEG
jgi:hypothetical protein